VVRCGCRPGLLRAMTTNAALAPPGRGPGNLPGIDVRAQAIGRGQHGLVTRRQLDAASVLPRSVRRRLADGDWRAVGPGVIDLGTHDPNWEQGLWCALLAADPAPAWASHRSAAYLHQLLDVPRPAVHDLTVIRGHRRQRTGASFHESRHLSDAEVTRVDGMPVTTVARTLLDLSADTEPRRFEMLVWDAARREPPLPTQLSALLLRHERRPGTPPLRAVLEGLHPQIVRAGSPFEVDGLLRFRDAGLPWPTLQHVVRDRRGQYLVRVDAAWIHARVIVEFDGAAYHRTPRQRARDEQRRQQLVELGWRVVVLRPEDLHGPRFVAVVAELHRLVGPR